jgi:arylsulfatase A-like enzyme
MQLKKSILFREALTAGIIGALIVGLLEAAYIYRNLGNYGDLYVFRYAAIAYGIFGIICGFFIYLIWLIIGRLKSITEGTAYCITLAFIIGAGEYNFLSNLFIYFFSLNIEPPHNMIGMFITGPLFALTLGWILLKVNKRLDFLFSKPAFNIVLVIILVIIPVTAGSIFRPQPRYSFINQSPAPKTSGGPHVIMIVADALRADYLRIYGGEVPTPALESLAADGIVFDNVFAPCSWTRPSFASLLTGMYPTVHGMRTYFQGKFPGNLPSLQKILSKTGYYTAGFFNNGNLAPVFNFQQDFDLYEYTYPENRIISNLAASHLRLYERFNRYSGKLIEKKYHPSQYYRPAEKIIPLFRKAFYENSNKSFFGLLHLMEPHDPYFPHPYDDRAFGHALNPKASKDEILAWKEVYHQEIAHMDSLLAPFFDWLRASGYYDSSLIIFTADHGEEFYDHGFMNHGTTLYSEVLHIPLIVKLPGNEMYGTRDGRLSSLVDIPATILGMLEMPIPEVWEGRNLLEGALQDRYVGADLKVSGIEMHTVFDDKYKFIKNVRSKTFKPDRELYNLSEDPNEKHNIIDEYPELAESLELRMESLLRLGSVAEPGDSIIIDHNTLEQLKALGYTE